ncbi:hypothetical protein ACIGXM_16020 [Kitasatospora sp. NPDC052896]|uniref:hypothetical protein n=1 Tax=Kitasatospora sp. NPDC052896 TaxID=3364061 RepID=UPI0037C8E341
MIAFALLIPPALLGALILLGRFEERLFGGHSATRPQLRVVPGERAPQEVGPATPFAGDQAA